MKLEGTLALTQLGSGTKITGTQYQYPSLCKSERSKVTEWRTEYLKKLWDVKKQWNEISVLLMSVLVLSTWRLNVV